MATFRHTKDLHELHRIDLVVDASNCEEIFLLRKLVLFGIIRVVKMCLKKLYFIIMPLTIVKKINRSG